METLVTALPAGITAGEAGEVGSTGPDMTQRTLGRHWDDH